MKESGTDKSVNKAQRSVSRSELSKYAKANHLSAANALCHGLTLADSSALFAVSAVWQARLTAEENAAIGYAALRATSNELAELVAFKVLEGAGMPLPVFDDAMADAGFWADCATSDERAAYAVACFNRFSLKERDEFCAFVEDN